MGTAGRTCSTGLKPFSWCAGGPTSSSKPLNLTVAETARQLGVSRQMLHSILAERSAVSPEMAVRLGRFCGNGAGFWLRMQTAHDLWHAERKLREEIQKIPKHATA
ncbi:MAG TPA: HigA family addiction module antitoxin [Thermoanaerobaculia bacterium]|nr:HigA family addiction module antitoxin [Thermoanaerobaculia bacterium]